MATASKFVPCRLNICFAHVFPKSMCQVLHKIVRHSLDLGVGYSLTCKVLAVPSNAQKKEMRHVPFISSVAVAVQAEQFE